MEVAEQTNENELLELGDRMIRLRYSMDSTYMSALFQDISISDYLVLSNLARRMGIHEEKVYLSDISKELDQPITRVSRLVQNLQNKGYVYWNHDSRGTYIYLSETGHDVMKDQQQTLRDFFQRVIERMGRDEFASLLDQMQQLEDVMEGEAASFLEENPPED